jgi:hypothetical protein
LVLAAMAVSAAVFLLEEAPFYNVFYMAGSAIWYAKIIQFGSTAILTTGPLCRKFRAKYITIQRHMLVILKQNNVKIK